MARVSTFLSPLGQLAVLFALACTASPRTTEQSTPTPDDIDTSAIPSDGPALLFPPPPTRRTRRLLPPHLTGVDDDTTEPFAVEWPELDDAGRWEMSGQTLTIRLSNRARRSKETAPPLSVTPAVRGTARWNSDWSLSFAADAPFDPNVDYTLKLGPIEDETGRSLEWTGSFRADPQIWVGGKLITYIPEPGKPRVVAFTPYDGTKQGSRPELTVLFDQPVRTRDVRDLIELTDDAGTAVPVTLRHPTKNIYDGAHADRRNVVLVRPKAKLRPATKAAFAVRDHGAPDSSADQIGFEVAPKLAFLHADCRDEGCTTKGDTLHITGHEIALHFNNVVRGGKVLESAIEVEPEVPNLSVWSYQWSNDGTVMVSGAFEPSTDYTIKLARAKDKFGWSLPSPVTVKVRTEPLSASVSMPEGLQFLDSARSHAFDVTTRNVDQAELRAWLIGENEAQWDAATSTVARREVPPEDPDITIDLSPIAKKNTSVTTSVNLLDHLEPGRAYIVELRQRSRAFDAPQPRYPAWSRASKPPLALLAVQDDHALVVHARGSGDKTLVHVADVRDGAPVDGAQVFADGVDTGVRTNDQGVAVLDIPAERSKGLLLRVESGSARTLLPMGHRAQTERHLTPELAGGAKLDPGVPRGLLMTDRGAYRPGATVHLKGTVREIDGATLRATAGTSLRLLVTDPTGKSVFERELETDDMGSVNTSWTTNEGARIGRYRVELFAQSIETPLAHAQIQVAEFEPPRFKVDVAATHRDEGGKSRVHAEIDARYLFGAAMDGARVTWRMRRTPAPWPSGPHTARGLQFSPHRRGSTSWSRSGAGSMNPSGTLGVDTVVEVDDAGPQAFTVEAEVTDESHRAIAGRDSVVVHPAPQYAGVRVRERWPDVGVPLELELGVIDTKGASLSGRRITAELVRMEWKRTRKPGPGGSSRVRWHEVEVPSGRCTVVSKTTPVSCALVPKKAGAYEVRTRVDGRRGGSVSVWAWGPGWSGSQPEPGHRLELTADAKTYDPGQRARVVAHNPFEQATALLTLEQGAVLHHETRDVEAGPVEFDIPIEAEHAPHVFATVTFLPREVRGEQLAQWKFGALKVPVSSKDARLDVEVSSNADVYAPAEQAQIEVAVRHGGAPVAGAEVALAVVDEGILRLTNHRAPDPVRALRPGSALHYSIADTRFELAEMLQRSHVAGDGMGAAGNASLVSTRKNFVRTALWRPDLRTDEHGRATVTLELPDNLTEFRIMAVVLDENGRGGKANDSFHVRKPLMLQPAVPRFALKGDTFDAAVMVHNGGDEPALATVRLDNMQRQVSLAPLERARVAFRMRADAPGSRVLTFDVTDAAGAVQDRVRTSIPIEAAGLDERPMLSGSFHGAQEILLEVPEAVSTDTEDDAFVHVVLGHAMWPELGSRLEYLVDYPHGCVEQTTSSTLPLLAARDILPRLGFFRFTQEDIDTRIRAGLKRLASMKTSSGGLAYWPGGYEPNLYGTAYAARAIALAKQQGLEIPGLLSDVTNYLSERLDSSTGTTPREVRERAAIALALAEADALPPSSADMLMDTLPHQGAFGIATVALALASQDDRQEQLDTVLNRLEAAFGDDGTLLAPDRDDFYDYGSESRSRAQAALALARLRPASSLLPVLADALIRDTGSYTTQATAFGLLALRERVLSQETESAHIFARLGGVPLVADESMPMGPASAAFKVPLREVAGRHAVLRLETSGQSAVSFRVSSAWRRPFAAGDTQVATSATNGPEVYRLYTTPAGDPVDMQSVAPGTVVRVALLARMPDSLSHERRGYLAMTDRIPAGFEAIRPDLWTVSRPAELTDAHPLFELLEWGSVDASHVELRDDRVHLYFDRFWGEYIAATYTIRATTSGTYTVPPAMAELMYEAESTGYSRDATVVVQ